MENHHPLRSGCALTLLLICTAMTVSAETPVATTSPAPVPDFSRLVVVGDSLSAGVQNLSLNEDFQPNGYAALIARQAGITLPLPLIARPGIPNALTLLDPGPPPVLGQEPGISSGRVNPFLQPMNVSVPNLKIDEFVGYRPDCTVDPTVGGIRLVDVYTELVLGLPGCLEIPPVLRSELEMGEALDPSFIVLWIGNNDTLWAAVLGVTSEITDLAVFRSAYETTVQRLAATGADMVIGNLPDVTTTAFLTSTEQLANILGLDLDTLSLVLGIGPGDFVTLFAFDAIEAILSGAIPGPLPDPLVVTAAELETIRQANAQFNNVVTSVAARYGVPVADIRGVLNETAEKGAVIDGQRLSTDYLGGIFSLDGFHPTNTGHALTANEFIRTINKAYKVSIPLVDVAEIKDADPLITPETGRPPRRK